MIGPYRRFDAIDALDDLSQEDLETPIAAQPLEMPDPWWERFKYDLYDWEDPEFIERNVGDDAYRPLLLTRGYFTIVSLHDCDRIAYNPDGSLTRWHVKVNLTPDGRDIDKVYAARKGRADEPRSAYLHRVLLNCTADDGPVDHHNGWGLDNRRGHPETPVNLTLTSRSGNTQNAQRQRTKNKGLPRGAEPIPNGRFRGMWCMRVDGHLKVVRSKETWSTPEPAAEWYREQLKERYGKRTAWAHHPTSLNWPRFPRLKPGMCIPTIEGANATLADDVPF